MNLQSEWKDSVVPTLVAQLAGRERAAGLCETNRRLQAGAVR